MIKQERKKNLQAYEYLVSVFENSPVALISLDTRLRIILFNRAAQELMGLSSYEVVGCRVNKIISFRRLKNILTLLRRRNKVSFEGYITKLTGSSDREIPVRLRISPILDDEKRLMGILLLASDLREIKRLQAKLLESERLAAITNLAVSVNHEINNPLCSILGNTQLILMEKERLDPRMVKGLKNIEKETVRIREVARRLARISKPVLKEYIDGKEMIDIEQSDPGDGTD